MYIILCNFGGGALSGFLSKKKSPVWIELRGQCYNCLHDFVNYASLCTMELDFNKFTFKWQKYSFLSIKYTYHCIEHFKQKNELWKNW